MKNVLVLCSDGTTGSITAQVRFNFTYVHFLPIRDNENHRKTPPKYVSNIFNQSTGWPLQKNSLLPLLQKYGNLNKNITTRTNKNE